MKHREKYLRGLQKLSFYCEICRRQFRDSNGFSCHIRTQAHLNRANLIGGHLKSIISQKSANFRATFLRILEAKYPNVAVPANTIYNELISNKDHVHMTGTYWNSLNGFIRSCAETNELSVEWSERGPIIKTVVQEKTSFRPDQNEEFHRKCAEAKLARETAIGAAFAEPKSTDPSVSTSILPEHEGTGQVTNIKITLTKRIGKQPPKLNLR